MKFNFLGTKIYISFLFLAPLCLLLFVDKSGLFLPSFLAIVLHETAHLVAMWVLRCNPKEITLIPASIRIVRDITYRVKNEVIISLSGPLVNLLFFSVFFMLYKFSNDINIMTFAAVNLLFAIFNLLPIKELDGGLVLYKVLEKITGQNRAQIVLNFVSLITGVILLLLGVWTFCINKNFSIIIFALYILLSVLIKL